MKKFFKLTLNSFTVAVFIYALIVMLAFNFLIIPQYFPGGTGDSEYYFELANQIAISGFPNELRPFGQGPIAIGSILIKAVGGKISIILFNAFIHAVAIYFLVSLLSFWFSLHSAIIGSIPLTLSPYMMLWYSQLSKESLSLLGVVLFVYGATGIVNSANNSFKYLLRYLISIIVAMMLFWLMRPYINQILIPAIAGYTLLLVYRDHDNYCYTFFYILIGIFICILFTISSFGSSSDRTLQSLESNSDALVTSTIRNSDVYLKCIDSINNGSWTSESNLESFIGSKFRSIMARRCLIYSGIGESTNVDKESSYFDKSALPKNTAEVLRYLPNGGFKGIFYPSLKSSYEAIVRYSPSPFYAATFVYQLFFMMSLMGFLLIFKKDGILPILILCIYVIALYGISTPFIGALVRYRYPWYMVVVSIGFAALVQRLFNKNINFLFKYKAADVTK